MSSPWSVVPMPTIASKLSERDEEKSVVNADGTAVGIVAACRGDTAYVVPDPDIADSIESNLGWGDVDDQ